MDRSRVSSLGLTCLEDRCVPAAVLSLDSSVFVQEAPDTTGIGQSLGFVPFEPSYAGPFSLAAVDQQLVAVGAGFGGGPRAQVWARGEFVYEKVFDEFAFEPSFRGGVNVALVRWDDDLRFDLVVGAGADGGPRVRVFLNTAGGFIPADDFFAFEPSFRGGVYVEGYRKDLVVAPGPGGGPRVQRYASGTLVTDQFITDPNNRAIVDYAYGVIGGLPRLCVLDGSDTLRTYREDFTPERVTTLYHPFDSLGVGDYVDFASTNLSGVSGQSLVSLDEVFGIPLAHVDFPAAVSVGNMQLRVRFQGPPPPLTPFQPLTATSIYQPKTPPDAVFTGVSIGRPGGTGTYTLTGLDEETGVLVGLTNAHVIGAATTVVTPGPAEAPAADAARLGTVLRTSLLDVDVGVFTLDYLHDPRLHLGYFDAFVSEYRERLLPAVEYDPGVVVGLGFVVYKIGRTTAVTRAPVEFVDATVDVEYPDGVRMQHGQAVASSAGFARPGDSGSMVVLVVDDHVYFVGQLFAGSYARGVFTPAAAVLAGAGLTFLGP